MSLKFDLFPIRPLTVGRFRSWLARSEAGAALEYHRGLLILVQLYLVIGQPDQAALADDDPLGSGAIDDGAEQPHGNARSRCLRLHAR